MITALAAFLAGILTIADGAAAIAHRDSEGLPPATTYYFSVSHLPESERDRALTALRLVLPSLSLEPTIDYQTIHPAGDGLYWIDTAAFGWQNRFPIVAARNPYAILARGKPSLVLRADWFVTFATDAKESTSYYDLLFGATPTSRDDFLSRVGVVRVPGQSFGMIEGNSGVILSKKRWIESFGMRSGYAYGTRDSSTVRGENDPLARPDGSFRHEAEEWIIGIPKTHVGSGVRGALQVYFLSDAAGRIQAAAPANIATDYTRVRFGASEVRNAVSCISCHAEGLIDTKQHEIRELIADGVEIYAKDAKERQRIEAFHLSDLSAELRADRQQFAAIVQAATGKIPREAVADFVATVKQYDADLTPERAAAELGVTVEDLTAATAYGQNTGKPINPRLVAIAHRKTIPRTSWESVFADAAGIVQLWRSRP